jgi:DHA2 family metal-tetracycline-proton antiporter-like MFS transporter
MLLSGSNFLIPFYLIAIQKLNIQQAGILMMAYAASYLFVSSRINKYTGNIHLHIICSIGMLSAIGAGLLFAYTLQFKNLIPSIIYLIWLGASYAIYLTSGSKMVMCMVPKSKQSKGLGILKTFNALGIMLGLCLFETLFSMTLPSNLTSFGISLKTGSLSRDLLIIAFQNTYLFGAIICFLAFTFSVMIRERPETIRRIKDDAEVDLEDEVSA